MDTETCIESTRSSSNDDYEAWKTRSKNMRSVVWGHLHGFEKSAIVIGTLQSVDCVVIVGSILETPAICQITSGGC